MNLKQPPLFVMGSPGSASRSKGWPKSWPKGWQPAYNVMVAVLLVGVIVARLLQLTDIPAGLYADETSIGYNAALIAETGIDEHGTSFPTYFRAFGEYKNPIYMYATALMFKLFGISAFNLRVTSVLFYLLALLLTLVLVTKVFNHNKAVELYALAGLGFLPVFFMLSRISFEVISQLTWVAAANLCIWTLFNRPNSQLNVQSNSRLEQRVIQPTDWFQAAICGLILGTSIYTYSTARLLSFLMLVLLWVIYFKRDYLQRLLVITATFALALIPYIIFTLTHPGATTERFLSISYIDDPIPFIEKAQIFVRVIFKYWSPKFLVVSGDANLRHATGHGGIVFYATLGLFLVGVASLIWRRQITRFHLFLLANLLLSPLAAVITSAGAPHALRSLLMGYYLWLMSCYGIAFLAQINNRRWSKWLMGGAALLLMVEIVSYQADYFIFYPPKSVEAMESFDVQSALQAAIDQHPQKIIFINEPRTSYANLAFYAYLVNNPQAIPMTTAVAPVPAANSCLVYHQGNQAALDAVEPAANWAVVEQETLWQPSPVAALLGVKPVEGIMKVRCYKAA